MKKRWIAGLLFTFALAACKTWRQESPPPNSSVKEDPIEALGSAMPALRYDRSYWQKQHDAKTPEWEQAKRLCGQTILANYPNCIPINDIVQTDMQKRGEAGLKARAKNEQMFRRGYEYDYARREWFPFRKMESAGCTTAYPKVGQMTWQCAPGTIIPQGITDPNFSTQGE